MHKYKLHHFVTTGQQEGILYSLTFSLKAVKK